MNVNLTTKSNDQCDPIQAHQTLLGVTEEYTDKDSGKIENNLYVKSMNLDYLYYKFCNIPLEGCI